jgi:hypothetical protein
VCVKISKNTKDILDQNLWEVSCIRPVLTQLPPPPPPPSP